MNKLAIVQEWPRRGTRQIVYPVNILEHIFHASGVIIIIAMLLQLKDSTLRQQTEGLLPFFRLGLCNCIFVPL